MSRIVDSIQNTGKTVLWLALIVMVIRTWQDPQAAAETAMNFVGTFFGKLGDFAQRMIRRLNSSFVIRSVNGLPSDPRHPSGSYR